MLAAGIGLSGHTNSLGPSFIASCASISSETAVMLALRAPADGIGAMIWLTLRYLTPIFFVDRSSWPAGVPLIKRRFSFLANSVKGRATAVQVPWRAGEDGSTPVSPGFA